MWKYLLALSFFLNYSLFAQSTYYISSSGNNANTGMSSKSPWKTLKNYVPGNTYLFKRGDVFNFSVPRTWSDPAYKTQIAAYGSGNKPVFSLYTQVRGRQLIKHSDRIWKVDLRNKNSFAGYLNYNPNIGFLKVDGVIYGNKLPALQSLTTQWDFYTDENYLYIFYSSAPSPSSIIEFSSNGIGIELSPNMIVRDVKVVGSGGHGVQGWTLSNVTIERVNISEIGGAYLPGFGDGTVRYGNGIEFWGGCNNCIVESCNVTQVYDVAYTMQGIGVNADFNNTVFRKNIADLNEHSFEAWAREGAPGFKSCGFVENTCSNAGYGWSHAVRPSKTEAVHLLTYIWDVANKDLLVENNTFDRAKSGLYHHNTHEEIPAYTLRNNKIYLDFSVPIRAHFPEITIANASEFVLRTGKEVGSLFAYTSSEVLSATMKLQYAVREDLNTVKLTWQLQSNSTEQGFEIERSYNGTSSFETIARFLPELKDLGTTPFEFIDKGSFVGTVFYRLKQFDGTARQFILIQSKYVKFYHKKNLKFIQILYLMSCMSSCQVLSLARYLYRSIL